MFIFNKIISSAVKKYLLAFNLFSKKLPIASKEQIGLSYTLVDVTKIKTYTKLDLLEDSLVMSASVISSDVYLNRDMVNQYHAFSYDVIVISSEVKNGLIKTYPRENIDYSVEVASTEVANKLIKTYPNETLNFSVEVLESTVT